MSSGVLQKLLWHAKQTFRITFNSASRMISPARSTTGVVSKTTSQLEVKPSAGYFEPPSKEMIREAAISRALAISGVSLNTDKNFAFLSIATRDVEWITGLTIRRHGDRLSKDELRSLKVRANVIMTSQFIAVLNERGATEPMVAADAIAWIINAGISSAECIFSQSDRQGRVKFQPVHYHADPCQAALAVGEIVVHKSDATILPLLGCSHPERCWCRYRHPATDMPLAYEVAEAYGDDPELFNDLAEILNGIELSDVVYRPRGNGGNRED